MIIHLTFHITLPPVLQDRPKIAPSYVALYDQEAHAREELLRTSHKITCDRCGWTGTGYKTAGRAKMGLSGHNKSCRKV